MKVDIETKDRLVGNLYAWAYEIHREMLTLIANIEHNNRVESIMDLKKELDKVKEETQKLVNLFNQREQEMNSIRTKLSELKGQGDLLVKQIDEKKKDK